MRLRNVKTGAVVSVREGKDMGSEWEPVDAPDTKKPTRRRSAKKSDTDDE